MLWLVGAFVLRNGYFLLFELTPRAATPGKRALGLRVVARDGGRLDQRGGVRPQRHARDRDVPAAGVPGRSSASAGEQVDAVMGLLALAWSGMFLLFPLFNRDRLRVGDFVAGTWVVRRAAPRLPPTSPAKPWPRHHRFDIHARTGLPPTA